MTCQPLLDPACLALPVFAGAVSGVTGATAAQAVGQAASAAFGGMASSIESSVASLVSGSIDWWVRLPSPDLAGEPVVGRLQQWMLPFAAAVAVLGMTIAGARMALTRKATPLIDAGSGLVTIAATSAVGVLLPALLLRAGDAWSDWVLNASTGGQFGARLTSALVLSVSTQGPMAVIVLGVIGMILVLIQAMLMLFRQAALVILAGVLPLSAAGTLNPATRPWFRTTVSWTLALVFYKPAAAAVYATAFAMIGTGRGLRTVLMGYVMVGMSLLALPALMRFFTWTTGTVADSASGGGFLQSALSGAAAVGALRGSPGGTGSAAGQARMMSDRLGPQAGQAARPGGARPAGSVPSGAAPAGGAARGAAQAAGRAGAPAAASAARAAGGPAGAAATVAASGASAARRAAERAMQPGGPDRAGQ